MLNAEHGTNLTDANVTGTYNNGTGRWPTQAAFACVEYLAYDADGRVGAVYSEVTMNIAGYIYDGLGRRIAKGTLDPMKVTLPLTGIASDIIKNGPVAQT